MHRRFTQFLIVVVSLVALDQWTKHLARAAVDGIEGRSIHPLWAGVFELKLVYNQGVAFGMLQGAGTILTPIAIAIALFAGWHSLRHPKESLYGHMTMALLGAGAIGNLIDRLWMGKVTDMFWIRLIDFPVFNIADVCITFAAVMLIVAALRELVTESKKPVGESDREAIAPSADVSDEASVQADAGTLVETSQNSEDDHRNPEGPSA